MTPYCIIVSLESLMTDKGTEGGGTGKETDRETKRSGINDSEQASVEKPLCINNFLY